MWSKRVRTANHRLDGAVKLVNGDALAEDGTPYRSILRLWGSFGGGFALGELFCGWGLQWKLVTKTERKGKASTAGELVRRTVAACLAAGNAMVRMRNWTRRKSTRESSGRCMML